MEMGTIKAKDNRTPHRRVYFSMIERTAERAAFGARSNISQGVNASLYFC